MYVDEDSVAIEVIIYEKWFNRTPESNLLSPDFTGKPFVESARTYQNLLQVSFSDKKGMEASWLETPVKSKKPITEGWGARLMDSLKRYNKMSRKKVATIEEIDRTFDNAIDLVLTNDNRKQIESFDPSNIIEDADQDPFSIIFEGPDDDADNDNRPPFPDEPA